MKKITLNQVVSSEQDDEKALNPSAQGQEQTRNNSAETAVDDSVKMVHNQGSVLESESDQTQSILDQDMKKKQKKQLLIICLVAILAGTGTGFGASRLRNQQAETAAGPEPVKQVAEGKIQKGDVFGMQDSDIFGDTAQGYLEIGGINGEGSHRLLRPGGDSQTVYLTSSVTDLDALAGAEVKVWGETYKGQKAGWLMDVGKVEVLEVEGEAPFEEEL